LNIKGINLRHRPTYKKNILGSLESIRPFQRMKWSGDLAMWRCELAMR